MRKGKSSSLLNGGRFGYRNFSSVLEALFDIGAPFSISEDKRGWVGEKYAMALKETNSNEESIAGKGQVYMLLAMDTCLLKWTTVQLL